ncbi:MAG TPA: SDR family NAD(P)-dependent oxidoreductase [bacterium]|nr:SDR family NAD(P)-dependent oxidoreductase [bacterium]
MDSTRMYALVTGASGGIGRQFARQLADQGKPCILVARDSARLAAVLAELPEPARSLSVAMPSDLSAQGAAASLYAACRDKGIVVDLLVNNAGSGVFGPSLSVDPPGVAAMIGLNVTALTTLCQLFGADMKARGTGQILNVGSFAGLNATPFFASYAATKSYVLNYSLALRAELAGSGVRVTCLLPGYVRTGFDEHAGIVSEAYKKFSIANSLAADVVARIGLRAMDGRSAFVIAGGRNRFAAFLFGLLPRTAPPAIMKRFLDSLV